MRVGSRYANVTVTSKQRAFYSKGFASSSKSGRTAKNAIKIIRPTPTTSININIHKITMMMSSQTPPASSGGMIRTMSTFTTLLLVSLSCCVVSPVTSFLLPRQQSLQHKSLILSTYTPINVDGQRSSSSLLLNQSSKTQEGESAATTSNPAAGTSKRAQRKAAQRAKKQRQQNSQSKNINKATSQHPEAIIKRQKQQEQQRNGNNKRRNHNFAQRAEYLSEGIDSDNDYGFHDNLDGLTLTQTIPNHQDKDTATNNIQFHQLHSQRVSKLDESTTADDVVKAIKRAQNLHDVHDVVEIAHFLLEEVGEFCLYH